MSREGEKGFHFNSNVHSSTGSITRMAINEAPFHRAMEIQERRREKREEELKKLEAEKKVGEPPAPETVPESAENDEDSPAIQDVQSEVVAVPEPEATVEAPAPAPKTSGRKVPKPVPRADASPEEREVMRKRAKAYAAEVRAKK